MNYSVPASSLYKDFNDSLSRFETGRWAIAIFEGSPCEGQYSWCPDCNFAYDDMRRFAARYKGPVKMFHFKVGLKEEWESMENHNPFRAKFPFLSDLPTAILFYGMTDVARVIAVREQDLEFLSERSRIYEKQIESGKWKPPTLVRVA